MDASTLIYSGLITLGAGYLLISRKAETAHQEVPIPIPVSVNDCGVKDRHR